MTKFVKGLFGGGDNGAKEEARKNRELQAVSNDRQLAEVNRADSKAAVPRKAPRGRRLFEDGPDGMSAVLGA